MSPRSTESLAVYVRQRHFRRVMRGYDPDEVDRHLDTISQMISTGALSELTKEHEERLAEREAAIEQAEAEADRLLEEARKALNAARVEADATIAGATLKAQATEQDAALLLEEARLKAEASHIVQAAHAEANTLLEATRAEADRILHTAKTEGLTRITVEVEQRKRELDDELEQYEARRRREADRLVRRNR